MNEPPSLSVPWSELESLARDQFTKKEYRPNVVLVIKNHEAYLVVRSIRADEHYFPQGGIKPDESIRQAIVREAKEELGILAHELTLVDYLGHHDLPTGAGRKVDGYSRGKRYFFFCLRYHGRGTCSHNPGEIADHFWVKPEDVPSFFNGMREERKTLLLHSFERALLAHGRTR